VGARARRVEKYYQDLLASETKSGNHADQQSDSNTKGSTTDTVCVQEKWKGQIEKVMTCRVFQFRVGPTFVSLVFSIEVTNLLVVSYAGFA
jgi:hypothetical protein